MFELYKYTDKEIEQIIDSMVYLVDTREHEGKNDHILNTFDKFGAKYMKRKLSYGDYSFLIPKNEDLSIPRDLDFSGKIMIERKSGLSEFIGNIEKDKARLKKELALAPPNKVLLIENASYSDVLHGNYSSNFSAKALWASIHSLWHEFNIPVFFSPQAEDTAFFIRGYFQYWLKNFLK